MPAKACLDRLSFIREPGDTRDLRCSIVAEYDAAFLLTMKKRSSVEVMPQSQEEPPVINTAMNRGAGRVSLDIQPFQGFSRSKRLKPFEGMRRFNPPR